MVDPPPPLHIGPASNFPLGHTFPLIFILISYFYFKQKCIFFQSTRLACLLSVVRLFVKFPET